ncbi:T9SS type A sorting domain-containing protein [Marinoscillum pacificum]|uniref:T9SS type A sorting domain-containing protein n=1 Tax=Marinoscillum pacificum TaxID=392723 RepID=UPI002158703E|nr:T9SS type A sorting domain-containing protein [Marinoscillum pacificum]
MKCISTAATMLLCSILYAQTTVYSEDFELGFGDWTSTNYTVDSDAALPDSDGNYLHTSSFDNYARSLDVTTSMSVDLSGYYNLILSFDLRYNIDDGETALVNESDGVRLEYSLNGGSDWFVLSNQYNAINWYNNNSVQALSNGQGWSGNNGAWTNSYIVLPAGFENNPDVRFRFRFASGVYITEVRDVGFGVDNIAITSYHEAPSTSAPGNVSTGLSLWLNSQGTILGNVSTNEIFVWFDDSGEGSHAHQSISGSNPTYSANSINNNPVINFDDDFLVGLQGIYTREFFIVLDPDFISSSSAETGDVLGYQVGDVGSLELGSSTSQYANELITHTIDPATSYRSSYIDGTGEVVLANPIIINDRLNGTSNGQNIFLNGQQVDNYEDVAVNHQNFDNQPYTLGYGWDFADDFQGGVAEVISYSGRLSDSDQADVFTYLAIKYGITLDEDPASATVNFDYQVDGSTIIWPGTTNAEYQPYHFDVAGIGKNQTNQKLNQVQSQSINDATIVSMAEGSDLHDGEYLVWGNNHNPNTFTTDNLISGISQRLQRIWKVKETGDVGTVALSFDITNLAVDKDNTTLNLIISPDTASMPEDLGDENVSRLVLGGTVTRSGGRDILTFEDVDFTDGDFFTIGGAVQTISPGGVSGGLTLWLRPNEGVMTTSTDLVTRWSDVSGNGNDADQGDNNQKPLLVDNVINGNDALYFTDDFLDGIAGFNTHEFFLVVKPDLTIQSSNDIGFLVGFKNGAFDGYYLGDQGDVTGAAVGYAYDAYRSADVSGSITSSVTLLNARNNVGGTGQELYANELLISDSESNAGSFGNRTNSYFRLGNNLIETETYQGHIAEVVSYNSRLTDAEKRDVATYLAIKYGITLNISSEAYTVNGVSIYDNTSYNNDIAGIGVNLDHGLKQYESMSQNDGAIVKVDGSDALSSGDYIVWGNDGTDKTLVQSTEVPGAVSDDRLSTEWKVDVYGNPGAVDLNIYLGDIANFDNRIQEASLYSLIINTSSDFSSITASYEGAYFSGDTLVFTDVDFNDNDFFTIMIPKVANLNAAVSLWLKANSGTSTTTNGAAVDTWNNSVNGSNNASSSGTARPLYVANNLNGNPVLDFDGSNDIMSGAAAFYSHDYFMVLDPDVTYSYNSTGGVVIGFENSQFSSFALGPITSAATNEVVTHLYRSNTSYRSAQISTTATYSSPGIFNSRLNSGGNGQNIRFNGSIISTNQYNTGTFANLSNRPYRIGRDLNNGLPHYNGKVAEIISFSSRLNNADRRDIETYLSVKYGISLSIASLPYTVSGSSIYNLTSHGTDIAGIGANTLMALYQDESKSINATAKLTIGSPSSLGNGDYLLFGHDGGALTTTSTGVPPTVSQILDRQWGIVETGDVGTVSVSLDLSGQGLDGNDVSSFTLILDDDTDHTNGFLSIVQAQTFESSLLTFENVEFSGGVYFSIGVGRDFITDTDGDGIPDYFELAYGTQYDNIDSPVIAGNNDDNVSASNPNVGINDTGVNGDGITDALERILIDNGATGPISKVTDTDGDGIPDWLEVANGTSPFDPDAPTANGDMDSDDDGIPDAFEAYILAQGGASNPDLGTDSDGDGIPDYYEVLMGSDPGDVNSPATVGGDDADGDGVTDAMEAILLANGSLGPINELTDSDKDGIADYLETLTDTDPYNFDSPGIPDGVSTIRALSADYQVVGSNCIDVSGYQWIYVLDDNGNLVYSINAVGNDLGSTCWAVRVLDGIPQVRSNSGGSREEYIMNRNWWIKPTNQPSSQVLIRFYALNDEPSDLRSKVESEGYDPNTIEDFAADSIYITKISEVDDLNPFVNGGTRVSLKPTLASISGLGYAYTININSFSSFVPHYSPSYAETPLPIELAYFKGDNDFNGVVLDWKTYSESNNEWFFIERAGETGEFLVIKQLPGSGTISEPKDYQVLDRKPLFGNNYYRLKQQDFDGKESSSEVIRVNVNEKIAQVKMYPNPAKNFTTISFEQSLNELGEITVKVYDLSGKEVNAPLSLEDRAVRIQVKDLQTGQYMVNINVNGLESTLPLIVR